MIGTGMSHRRARTIVALLAWPLVLLGHEARAADPVTTEQIDLLKQQVATLQTQVATLRQLLSITADGTTSLIAAQNRKDITGISATNEVGMDLNVAVGRNATQRLNGIYNVNAGKRILLEAGDDLILRSGSSLIQLRKDGSIVIRGVSIAVEASGDVVIKGAKVLTN